MKIFCVDRAFAVLECKALKLTLVPLLNKKITFSKSAFSMHICSCCRLTAKHLKRTLHMAGTEKTSKEICGLGIKGRHRTGGVSGASSPNTP